MNTNDINELVSVVIPTCDRGDLFYRALRSVIEQTYPNIEIIIVDDGSTRKVDISLVDFKERSFILKRNEKKQGGAISRNLGAKCSSGKYICFLDDDDYYYADKIFVLMKELIDNNNVDVVFGRLDKKSEPNRIVDTSCISSEGFIFNKRFVRFMHTNTSLYRKDKFDLIKFDEELSKFQDTQLHIESIKYLNCKYIDKSVAYWNDNHGMGQITSMSGKENHMRHIQNYLKLINNLRSRKSISFSYSLYMRMKFIYKIILFVKSFHILPDIR
ncbi:glycosyltransferase [Vibrio tritonius]|uniref:Glycosyltransferase n=1 Tax=Vibrio tritonius TaxID=1435069 RepID=A0ABS7YKB5_9VIBR|nr:glycosyltransferase family 2 protein [Vibrio tritonius]MCA2016113.1 glycosyltransferase [Vibrio tritonius]